MTICATCKRDFAIEVLDAKPVMDAALRAICNTHGQEAMLQHAAERGYDFVVLECERCYGPGYLPLGAVS